ncbi:hypothetical protein [Chryseobacterium sp. NFX27]|uniref:hypothetical protein n=1 Tax=Chryseobacterium sp. NFX27 TaxID=2819618 RepID=UPI003CF73869
MKTEYRDENFKLKDGPYACEKKFRWYRHFLSYQNLKNKQCHSDCFLVLSWHVNKEFLP